MNINSSFLPSIPNGPRIAIGVTRQFYAAIVDCGGSVPDEGGDGQPLNLNNSALNYNADAFRANTIITVFSNGRVSLDSDANTFWVSELIEPAE